MRLGIGVSPDFCTPTISVAASVYLVLYGVKESENDTPEVRKEHDGNEWQKIFEELGVEGCTVDQVIRLGRAPGGEVMTGETDR